MSDFPTLLQFVTALDLPELTCWQRAMLQPIDAGRTQHSWWLPRGSGKTMLSAAVALWEISKPGRRRDVYCFAADQDQGRLLRDKAADAVRGSVLAGRFDVALWKITNRDTQSVLHVYSSDVPSSWGLTPSLVVLDEVSSWEKRDLFDSLYTSSHKLKDCVLISISTAGHTGHWSHELFNRAKADSRWCFVHRTTPAEWIGADALDQMQALLPPAVYQRTQECRWTDAASDLFDEHAMDDAMQAPVGAHPAAGYAYGAGLDLGLRKDAAAFVVVGRSPKGVYEVAHVSSWRPQGGADIQLGEIEATVEELHGAFKWGVALADPWQSGLLTQNLQGKRVPIKLHSLSVPNWDELTRHLIDLFGQRLVAFRHGGLREELRSARLVESTGGKLRIQWLRTKHGHGDIGMAFTLALLAARDAKRPFNADAFAKVVRALHPATDEERQALLKRAAEQKLELQRKYPSLGIPAATHSNLGRGGWTAAGWWAR